MAGFLLVCAALWIALSWMRPMWNDEIMTFYVANQPTLPALVDAIRSGCDNQPPLYALIVRALQHVIGPGAMTVRFPSLVGFCIMTWCVFEFSRRRLPALYAILVPLAVCMGGFYFATEGRSYGLALGCAGVALLLWQRAAEARPRTIPLIGLGLSLSAAIALHYYAIFLLVPFVAGELARAQVSRRLDWPVLAAVSSPALVLVLHLPLITALRVFTLHPWAKARIEQIGEVYSPFFVGLVGAPVLVLLPLAILWIAWRFAPLPYQQRGPGFRRHEWVAGTALAILPAIVVMAALLTTHVFVARYAFATGIGVGIVIAGVAHRLFQGGNRAALVLATALLALLSLRMARLVPLQNRLRFGSEVGDELARMPKPGVPVAITDPLGCLELSFYSAAPLKQQLVCVVSPPRDLQWKGYNTDAIQLETLARFAPVHVSDYDQDFLSSNRSFLLATSPRHWIIQALKQKGYRVSSLYDPAVRNIFQVEAPVEAAGAPGSGGK